MLTNSQIAETAYNETVHASNPQWADIQNKTFRGALLQEVIEADAGRSSDTPYGHAVAALVATRKAELEKDVVVKTTPEPVPVPHPSFDEVGNPLPTPGAGPTRVPVVPIDLGNVAQPEHADSVLAAEAEAKRIADEKQAQIDADLKAEADKADAGKVN